MKINDASNLKLNIQINVLKKAEKLNQSLMQNLFNSKNEKIENEVKTFTGKGIKIDLKG